MIEKEYLANRVANANEAQLVALMYEGLIDTMKSAICAMNQKDKAAIDHDINKSRAILSELLATTQGDSEIAGNLRGLYIYTNKLVTEAEIKDSTAKLEEAIKVITPLYEAWQALGEKDEEAVSQSPVSAAINRPSIVAGMTYGKGQLNDYVINNDDRWKRG